MLPGEIKWTSENFYTHAIEYRRLDRWTLGVEIKFREIERLETMLFEVYSI